MPTPAGVIRQAAAIPLRDGQVGLVSSRSGKRWVVPKGCLEVGKSAAEIALQEAYEEAGLVGRLQPEPIGSYVYQKDGLTCHVLVFVLHVSDAVDNYPEAGLRQRAWLSPAQAMARLEDAGLRELVRGAAPPARAG